MYFSQRKAQFKLKLISNWSKCFIVGNWTGLYYIKKFHLLSKEASSVLNKPLG